MRAGASERPKDRSRICVCSAWWAGRSSCFATAYRGRSADRNLSCRASIHALRALAGSIGKRSAATARLTSIGDPILVTAMCSVTGGITAPFFRSITSHCWPRCSLRRDAHALGAGVSCGADRSAVRVASPTQPIGDLFVALFHLAFSAALGAMLAGWARTIWCSRSTVGTRAH